MFKVKTQLNNLFYPPKKIGYGAGVGMGLVMSITKLTLISTPVFSIPTACLFFSNFWCTYPLQMGRLRSGFFGFGYNSYP